MSILLRHQSTPSPSPAPGGAWRRRVAAFLAAVGVAATVVPLSAAVAGAAPLADLGCQTVHAGPGGTSGSTDGYFRLTAEPGSVAQLSMVLANPESYGCSVQLLPSWGATAVNSGDTYAAVAPGSSCVGVSCWLRGLDLTVPIPAHGRVTVPFSVVVPAGTTPGDYLAGVLAAPGGPPPAPVMTGGSDRTKSIGASVVARVALGVAVTVPGPLEALLRIAGGTLIPRGDQDQPLLQLDVRNLGNTWQKGTGTATVTAGAKRYATNLVANTILPGQGATLDATIPGVPAGRHPVHAVLWYAGHTKTATWDGYLDFPVPPTIVDSPGRQTVVVAAGTRSPTSQILMGAALAAGAAGAVGGTWWFIVAWKRRRRPTGKHARPPAHARPGPPRRPARRADERSPVAAGKS